VDFLDLRERLELAREDLSNSVAAYVRPADAEEFPADGGKAFQTYVAAALKALNAKDDFPEIRSAFANFDGRFNVDDPLQRGVLGTFLGDYLHVRYGADIIRELKKLVARETFNNVYEENVENPEFHAAFDHLEALAGNLGLQVQNHAYETLEITLQPQGAEAQAASIAMFTHVEVMRPVAYKWDSPTRPFRMVQMEGRWVGLGVYSDKGPTLVNLFALRVLADAKLKLSRPITLLVGSTTSTPGASVQSSLEKLAAKPALVLAADGYFPYSKGQMGNLLARVSSVRGMKSLDGLEPEMFYIYKLSAYYSMNSVPAETRAWVLYRDPVDSLNPSLDMVNKWRGIMEPYQATIPVTRYGTYVQDDTLHFFSYTLPSHVESRNGRNAIMDLGGALSQAPMLENSAWDIIRFVHEGLQMEPTGEAGGLLVEHPEMGTTRLNPVQFDRIGDEVSVLVDIRWPVGRDRAWIRERMQELVDRINAEHGCDLSLDWEAEGREPIEFEPPPAVADWLIEAYEISSGDIGAEAAAISTASGTLLPWAIPFGPERPGVDKHGHTRYESISERELSDLAVAYASALAWFATATSAP
jgi:acetylornithine deacetylase/succinyl-diaminopimelate desuccinylase-like protein